MPLPPGCDAIARYRSVLSIKPDQRKGRDTSQRHVCRRFAVWLRQSQFSLGDGCLTVTVRLCAGQSPAGRFRFTPPFFMPFSKMHLELLALRLSSGNLPDRRNDAKENLNGIKKDMALVCRLDNLKFNAKLKECVIPRTAKK